MKLAEALITRANMQTKLSELEGRLYNNARVQEGDEPSEDPYELLKEYDDAIKALESLISRINLTNSTTKVDDITITELIAKKDCLKKQHSAYTNFLQAASHIVARNRPTEIKVKSTVNIKDFQTKIDKISAELRKTDMKIQELNWTIELI